MLWNYFSNVFVAFECQCSSRLKLIKYSGFASIKVYTWNCIYKSNYLFNYLFFCTLYRHIICFTAYGLYCNSVANTKGIMPSYTSFEIFANKFCSELLRFLQYRSITYRHIAWTNIAFDHGFIDIFKLGLPYSHCMGTNA